VQRAAAYLLIALVGLMAFLPVAMCPCSTRFVPSAEAAAQKGRPVDPGCCPLCRTRVARSAKEAARAAKAGAQAPAPSQPKPCPCCQINGQGKWLVSPGADVKAPVPTVGDAFEVPPPPAVRGSALDVVLAHDAVPHAPASPPGERRAGVVLLI
jgi:hypothetical protein